METGAESGYSRQLRLAALVLPSLLIAALVALDYFVLQYVFPSVISHLVTLVVGVAGVLAFSTAIFNRLSLLQARERQNARRLRSLADALEQKRTQLQAVNAAGLALTSELDREEVLQRVADQARLVADAKYAALGVFDEEGVLATFTTSGLSAEERERIGPLPRGRGLLGHLQRDRRSLRLADPVEISDLFQNVEPRTSGKGIWSWRFAPTTDGQRLQFTPYNAQGRFFRARIVHTGRLPPVARVGGRGRRTRRLVGLAATV